VPLLPFLERDIRTVLMTACVSAVAYYALLMPLACVPDGLPNAFTDLAEGLITLVPPTIVLARMRSRRRAAA
jgi:hypothetical protein